MSEFIREVGYFEEEIVFEPDPVSDELNPLFYVHKGEL